MSIFADQVSMPTFGMTQYSGDWRSKARAIAARENAMLQQMAEGQTLKHKLTLVWLNFLVFLQNRRSIRH